MILLDDLTPMDMALLLEAVDSSAISSSEGEGTSDSTVEAPRLTDPPPKANEYRHRVRREIQRLREEVVALEHQLDLVRNRGDDSVCSLATAPLWKRIARRQKTARFVAEQENSRLRATLDHHLKAVRDLKKILWKRSLVSPLDQLSSTGIADSTVWPPIRFNHLGMMDQIDVVFKQAGLSDCTSDFQDVSIGDGTDSQAKSINVRYVRILPFDFKTIRDRLWTPSAIMPWGDTKYETVTWSDDLVIIRSETPSQLRRVEVVVYTQLVLRRFKKADRTDHYYDMHYLIRSDHPPFNSIHVYGQGCYAIEGLGTGSEESPTSIVLCWERAELHGSATSETDYFRDIIRQHFDCHFNSVEDILMDAVIESELE